jgi:hypothetical protein
MLFLKSRGRALASLLAVCSATGALAAEVLPFASKEAAEAFLSEALPRATAANPKYRSGAEGVLSAWLTKAIKFGKPKDSNDLIVSMHEDALEFRNGARTGQSSHDTEFSLGAVTISERRDEGTLDENGKPALAILFQCNAGKCIQASYGGKPAAADFTDISIQDAALRAQILAAFQMLKDPAAR